MDDGSLNAIYRAETDEKSIPESIHISEIKVPKTAIVRLLGYGEIPFEKNKEGINLIIPKDASDHPPCDFAWSFHISEAK